GGGGRGRFFGAGLLGSLLSDLIRSQRCCPGPDPLEVGQTRGAAAVCSVVRSAGSVHKGSAWSRSGGSAFARSSTGGRRCTISLALSELRMPAASRLSVGWPVGHAEGSEAV